MFYLYGYVVPIQYFLKIVYQIFRKSSFEKINLLVCRRAAFNAERVVIGMHLEILDNDYNISMFFNILGDMAEQ